MPISLPAEELILAALQLAEQKPVRGARFAQFLRQLNPNFSPIEYGAPTLRVFLGRYPGVVNVERDDGTDILVKPAAEPSSGSVASTPPLRRDLWMAFTLVNDSLLRFYDRAADAVITIAREPRHDEPAEVKARRDVISKHPNKFVQITPVSPEELASWIRNFSEGVVNQDDRLLIDAALLKPQWFREFQAVLRARLDLARAWRKTRTELVMSRVKQWQLDNRADIPSLFQLSRRVGGRSLAPDVEPARAADCSGSRRQQILAALARMPTSMLLAIPIPGEYWFDGQE